MAYILLALQLLPAILAAVKAAEAFFPQPGSGADKLALVTGTVEAVYDAAGNEITKDYSKETVTSLIVAIVARTVALLNKLGVFTKN